MEGSIKELSAYRYSKALERLQRVIDYMPDDKIIQKLYEMRGKGRNDWPAEAMWNAFLISFVFEHRNI